MPRFDELAPDQKAVLQLLLKQGKSYDDIAGLLRLDRTSVRERALDALDALGADAPGAADLEPERQDELADHLLLQQSASQREASRTFLEHSAPGRAWARRVTGELSPIGGDALPDVPAEPAVTAGAWDDDDRGEPRRSSKLGGALLLGALFAIAAVIAVLALNKSNDQSSVADTGAAVTNTAATGTSGTTGPNLPDQQINLTGPPGGSKKALGAAIISQGGFQMLAQGLPQSTLYQVWLWNSAKDALPLGFLKYDTTTKRLAGAYPGTLPAEAANYANVVLTRQASAKATAPGPIVLGGAIKRG